MKNLVEKIINRESIYKGKIIDLEKLTVTLPNGNKASREVIRHRGACAIVALTDDNHIILEHQYRAPFDKILIEIPAGKIDCDEEPLTCAKRELLEETGYVSNDFTFLTKLALAPGYSDEVIHLYLAKNITLKKQNLDEDEFLLVEKVPLKKAKEMVLNGTIENSIAVVGILYVNELLG
ncbi:MAG: NUDIX hydrolase [Clostridiales bacterium]|nr:NUDIX hydrolase [Clostridiales bacterium]